MASQGRLLTYIEHMMVIKGHMTLKGQMIHKGHLKVIQGHMILQGCMTVSKDHMKVKGHMITVQETLIPRGHTKVTIQSRMIKPQGMRAAVQGHWIVTIVTVNLCTVHNQIII